MNTTLRQAQAKMNKLRRQQIANGLTTVCIILDFSRDKDDTKRLVGSDAFYAELENQKNRRSEESILKACKKSGLRRTSVHTHKKEVSDFVLTVRCTNEQFKRLLVSANFRK